MITPFVHFLVLSRLSGFLQHTQALFFSALIHDSGYVFRKEGKAMHAWWWYAFVYLRVFLIRDPA